MIKYLIMFILFTNYIFAQNITTKFILSGYLADKPEITSSATCEFKKNKEVNIIDFMGNNWWKVNYNDCIGYVTSPFILITDDLIKYREIKHLKLQKEIKYKKDSIINRNDSIKRNDSIAKIEKKQRIDSIKLNILDYAKDSLLYVAVKKGSSLKQSPDVLGDVILTLSKDRDVMILDYSKGYFKVCVDLNCGYISDVFFNSGSILNFEMENQLVYSLVELRKKEEKIEFRKKQIEKFGEETYYKLSAGYYWIGMTKEMARLSLGNPKDINRSVGSWGVHEQWVYKNKNLYFEDGILTSWQD